MEKTGRREAGGHIRRWRCTRAARLEGVFVLVKEAGRRRRRAAHSAAAPPPARRRRRRGAREEEQQDHGDSRVAALRFRPEESAPFLDSGMRPWGLFDRVLARRDSLGL